MNTAFSLRDMIDPLVTYKLLNKSSELASWDRSQRGNVIYKRLSWWMLCSVLRDVSGYDKSIALCVKHELQLILWQFLLLQKTVFNSYSYLNWKWNWKGGNIQIFSSEIILAWENGSQDHNFGQILNSNFLKSLRHSALVRSCLLITLIRRLIGQSYNQMAFCMLTSQECWCRCQVGGEEDGVWHYDLHWLHTWEKQKWYKCGKSEQRMQTKSKYGHFCHTW